MIYMNIIITRTCTKKLPINVVKNRVNELKWNIKNIQIIHNKTGKGNEATKKKGTNRNI